MCVRVAEAEASRQCSPDGAEQTEKSEDCEVSLWCLVWVSGVRACVCPRGVLSESEAPVP